jgi:hypothetical protein
LAADQVLSPGCDALIVQVPAARKVARMPETVQMGAVWEENETGSPEEAVAERLRAVPAVWVGIVAKLIVCDLPFTVKLCVTDGAAE